MGRLIERHSNAFIVPVVYFFYPETAYRSLEGNACLCSHESSIEAKILTDFVPLLLEMDNIFRKTTHSSPSKVKPLFDVVKIAKKEPRLYGKHGELLVNYEDTEAHLEAERRRSSIVGGYGNEKPTAQNIENIGGQNKIERFERSSGKTE
jgi:hypothetical protein